jgi:hypothetical protein
VPDRLTEQLRNAARAYGEKHSVDPGEGPGPGGPGGGGPFGWFTFVVLAVLVGGGWFLLREMQADSKLQDCLMSGRKNCAPIDTSALPHGR